MCDDECLKYFVIAGGDMDKVYITAKKLRHCNAVFDIIAVGIDLRSAHAEFNWKAFSAHLLDPVTDGYRKPHAFSSAPPHRSLRVLIFGDMNWESSQP